MRRVYDLNLTANRRSIEYVVIDPHYEDKHRESVSDSVILELLLSLDGREIKPGSVDSEGFQYFMTDPHFFMGKPYRLV